MPRANEKEFINSLKAQCAVRLNLIHVYRRKMPYPSKVEVYVCHCGRKFRGKAFNIDDINDQIWQRSSEKFVGCKFLVKIIRGDGKGQEIEVHVNPHHNGHEPGSESDAYFLPVYHSAKENCAEMLSYLNNIKFVLTYSRRCENILWDQAPLHEQRTFHFFLEPVEASNLSYHLQRQERCNEDDYEVVKKNIP
jgi:ribosomal protein L31E